VEEVLKDKRNNLFSKEPEKCNLKRRDRIFGMNIGEKE